MSKKKVIKYRSKAVIASMVVGGILLTALVNVGAVVSVNYLTSSHEFDEKIVTPEVSLGNTTLTNADKVTPISSLNTEFVFDPNKQIYDPEEIRQYVELDLESKETLAIKDFTFFFDSETVTADNDAFLNCFNVTWNNSHPKTSVHVEMKNLVIFPYKKSTKFTLHIGYKNVFFFQKDLQLKPFDTNKYTDITPKTYNVTRTKGKNYNETYTFDTTSLLNGKEQPYLTFFLKRNQYISMKDDIWGTDKPGISTEASQYFKMDYFSDDKEDACSWTIKSKTEMYSLEDYQNEIKFFTMIESEKTGRIFNYYFVNTYNIKRQYDRDVALINTEDGQRVVYAAKNYFNNIPLCPLNDSYDYALKGEYFDIATEDWAKEKQASVLFAYDREDKKETRQQFFAGVEVNSIPGNYEDNFNQGEFYSYRKLVEGHVFRDFKLDLRLPLEYKLVDAKNPAKTVTKKAILGMNNRPKKAGEIKKVGNFYPTIFSDYDIAYLDKINNGTANEYYYWDCINDDANHEEIVFSKWEPYIYGHPLSWWDFHERTYSLENFLEATTDLTNRYYMRWTGKNLEVLPGTDKQYPALEMRCTELSYFNTDTLNLTNTKTASNISTNGSLPKVVLIDKV